MSSKSELISFKDSILKNKAIGEKVEVNQRHLIDKILARYSAEFTVFRELLQNSNDACAEEVEIVFKTNKSEITSIEYKNNGNIFREDDWNRLKKIAEGNPDEQKIGFFGVGFYSLFSIAEEPFVVSGDTYCLFFWKDNQLYVDKGTISEDKQKKYNTNKWTSFILNLRNPLKIPDTNEFSRFLVTSLGFTSSLKSVKVIVNDKEKIFVNKALLNSKPLEYSNNRYINKTLNNILELKSIVIRNIQMNIQVKGDLDVSYEENIKVKPTELTHYMRVTTGSYDVNLQQDDKNEIKRTIKKNSPSETKISILSTNFEEYEKSTSIRDKNNIFKNLIPYPDQGKIFIGFPTQQTTGCCIHLQGNLIPTVERESIDFVNNSIIARWNEDLLCGGYLLSRIIFEEEMTQISNIYEHDSKSIKLLNRTIYNYKTFSKKESTPNSIVGKKFYDFFFSRCKFPLSILTSKGVVPVDTARLPDSSMSKFIKDIPVVHERIINECVDMIKSLIDKNLLKEISVEDVFKELKTRALNQEELIHLMKWWIKYRKRSDIRHSQNELDNFLKFTKYSWKSESPKETITLSQIKNFVNSNLDLPKVTFPDDVLTCDISKEFLKTDLETYFGGWKELPLNKWTSYVLNNDSFSNDVDFIEKVLSILSKCSSGNFISHEEREQINSYLKNRKCIPTQQGLKLPEEAYFPYVNLFEDLPIINLKYPDSVSETFLKALSVKEHVDIQMIFDRLNTLNWDHIQLIKYLTSVSETLSDDEWNKLRKASIFPSENSNNNQNSRYCVSELYFPKEALRKLDVPIISWNKNEKLNKNTDEGKFLIKLGLQEYIPLKFLIESLIPTCDIKKRKLHLDYFIDNYNFYKDQYDPSSIIVPFLPCSKSDILALPYDCYSDPSCEIMDYKILISDLTKHADRFGVKSFPSPRNIINKLINHPPTIEMAPKVFSFISNRLSDFTPIHLNRLKQNRFIPIIDKDKKDDVNNTKWVEPCNVYLKETNKYEEIFEYVDFGQNANKFLQACGVLNEPNISELTSQIIKKPDIFLEKYKYKGYLDLLCQIAANMKNINRPLLIEMKNSPFLLCNKENNTGENKSRSYDYKLEKASNIYLIDDYTLERVFNPLCVPKKRLLINMYNHLGSQWLSKVVKESWTYKGSPMETEQSQELEELINKRNILLESDDQFMKEKGLNYDSQCILSKLKVKEVSDIEIKRKFNNIEKTEKSSACIVNNHKNDLILLITREFRHYDVVRILCQILFKRCGLRNLYFLDALLFNNEFLEIISSNNKKRNFNQPKQLPSRSSDKSIYTFNKNITEPTTTTKNKTQEVLPSSETNLIIQPSPIEQITPDYIKNLNHILENGKVLCNTTNEKDINTQIRSPDDQSVEHFKSALQEQCQIIQENQLRSFTQDNTKIYVEKTISEDEIKNSINSDLIHSFILDILKPIFNIFRLESSFINVYYDSKVNIVAFNRQRCLFFNLCSFKDLHFTQQLQKNKNAKEEALIYWFMVVCHELAHNLETDHNSIHEFYLSSYAAKYMKQLIEYINRL